MELTHEEVCRRQHRIVAHYLAITAWVNHADCVVLGRETLERLFGLKRFKAPRQTQLVEDAKPWFRYSLPLMNGSSIRTLALSRVSIIEHVPDVTLWPRDLTQILNDNGVKTSLISAKGRTEKEIISHLSLLNAGLVDPRKKPGKK